MKTIVLQAYCRFFTLIELLIVIAIIAVLAGMLLPALNSARASALQTKCNSNLKQLGVGFQMYQNDYDGYFPLVGRPNPEDFTISKIPASLFYNTGRNALDQITPYLKGGAAQSFDAHDSSKAVTPVLVCPADVKKSPLSSYGANYYIVGNGNPGDHPKIYRMNKIRQPSKIFVEADATHHTFDWNSYSATIMRGSVDVKSWGFRHRDQINFLFAGGNVGSQSRPLYGNNSLQNIYLWNNR